MNHDDVLKAAEMAKRNMATETLGTLRQMRDKCPDEWDAIVRRPEVGKQVLEMWDHLKRWEG